VKQEAARTQAGQRVPPLQYSQKKIRSSESGKQRCVCLPRACATRCPSSALRSRSGAVASSRRRLPRDRVELASRSRRGFSRQRVGRGTCSRTLPPSIGSVVPKNPRQIVLPSQTSLSHGIYAGHHDTERPIGRSVRWTPLTIPLQLQRALLRPLCAHVVLYVGPTRISPPPNWSARTHEQLQRAQEAARCVDIVAETIATRTTVPRHGQRPCSRYLLLYAHLLLAF
jgi:hypothetical protein